MENAPPPADPLATRHSPFAHPADPFATRHSPLASPAEQALLDLRICDPACGSGHFLIAAAERLAVHLARLRTGDDQPGTLAVQQAKRQIIGRCIYGVDLNPMAVELCKVSLWMEALEPGKPLSFLDHHIQCGNSLLGTTPALLAGGIPDEAFTVIEGDERAVVTQLKRENKQERKDHERGYRDFHFAYDLGNLPAEFARLSGASDESVADSQAKADHFAALVRGTPYQNARLLADAWCAAFVWKKDSSSLGKLCPTDRGFRNLQASPASLLPHVRAEIERLRDQYHFFHWHLAFPDIFRLPSRDEDPENDQCGWSGGFDVLLGNPPWDQIQVNDKEFFASTAPDIAEQPHMAARKRAISDLGQKDPELYREYKQLVRTTEGTQHFAHNSQRFPFGAVGRLNTAPLFTETVLHALHSRGRAGAIVPSGIATDSFTQSLFRLIVSEHRLASLFEFENVGFFTSVGQGHMNRFCLMTLCGSRGSGQASEFMFQGRDVVELQDSDRRFSLSEDDFGSINPNTRTCPIFRNSRDARIALSVYRRMQILENEKTGVSPWGFNGTLMIMMNTDSGLFLTKADVPKGWENEGNPLRLYEAKMMFQFEHRYGDFAAVREGEPTHRLPSVPIEDLQNPGHITFPRYWVPREKVEERLDGNWRRKWFSVWRNVTDSRASARTVIVAILPYAGVSEKIPLLLTNDELAPALPNLVANLNSFVLDYIARQKVGGTSLNAFYLKQFPVLQPEAYSQSCNWSIGATLFHWIHSRVLELTYTAWDLEPFSRDCGYDGPPFRWDEERRFLMRCELDAAYFHLYGIARDDVDYILETFPIVKRKDIARHGDYRTKLTILRLYDALAEATATGRPYQTPLDPPPGPPTDAAGQFVPVSEWDPGNWPPHVHRPR
jgi:hypothetical protein